METKDILTVDTVRRDLTARVRGNRMRNRLGLGLLAIPFLLVALFTLIFEAYWWALSMVLIPIALAVIESASQRRALRRIAGRAISFREAEITEIRYDELEEAWDWTRLFMRTRGPVRVADYLVFGEYGRVKDIYGHAHILMVGETCYLAVSKEDEVLAVYPSRAWRLK